MALTLTPFDVALRARLDKCAAEDPTFAAAYAKPNKSLEECCRYIFQEVEKANTNKMNKVGCDGDEIVALAIHYYDEDDIEVKGPDGKIVGYGAGATPANADEAPSTEATETKPKTRKPRKPKAAVDPNIPEPLDIPIF